MRKLITFFIALIMVVMLLMLISLQSCVTHRPRYKHWAKPYKMYEPVKQHKPSVK